MDGMLAAAIGRRLSAPEFSCTGSTIETLDITDRRAFASALDVIRPQWVINCAALTNVDDCERDPALAHRVNVEGARIVAEACSERGIALMHISTDYVFDGSKGSPYVEEDPVNPINHYGESKLRGEQAVAEACPDHRILRVSMLYGVDRTNFADFVASRIESGEPVKAITDNAGSPTHCPDIAEQVAALIGRPETGIFHCAGAGGCSRLEFAERIRDLWPAPELEIIPVRQADFPQMLAKRPVDTRLECRRLKEMGLLRLRPWQEAVADYLAARGEHRSQKSP
jgi:dTDP-4-dehydrorhamnose reductase